jgi:hypothetical protein
MKTTHHRKRVIAGALLSAGVAIAGMGLSAGTAERKPRRGDRTPGALAIRRWKPETSG